MIQIATTIEQSKKLLELGLSPETADMNYYHDRKDDYYIKVPMVGKPFNNDDIPCWSVGVLLEVMPKMIIDKDDCIYSFGLFYLPFKEQWCSCYKGDGFPIVEYESNNVLEACYNMMVWLLENNYIKG